MPAELTLDLPWVEGASDRLEGLTVGRGRNATLRYDDGIELEVRILDPGQFKSVDELVDAARRAVAPGQVVLVAGAVPLPWRPQLRDNKVSFVDASGVAEINWPRLRVSARRFGQPVKRRRSPVSFQKGHALVAQELLVATAEDAAVTINALAEAAGVGPPTASKAVSQLAQHGLVAKQREGHRVWVRVVDRAEIASRLAEHTAWPGGEALSGFLWGRSVFDVAARISKAADRSEIELANTGRVGAAFLGVLGTSSPNEVRCWVRGGDGELPDLAERLGLEPASDDAANVVLSRDPWRVGVHRRSEVMLDEWSAWIAHPVRVWCDLHGEQRGAEFAAQMWSVIERA